MCYLLNFSIDWMKYCEDMEDWNEILQSLLLMSWNVIDQKGRRQAWQNETKHTSKWWKSFSLLAHSTTSIVVKATEENYYPLLGCYFLSKLCPKESKTTGEPLIWIFVLQLYWHLTVSCCCSSVKGPLPL